MIAMIAAVARNGVIGAGGRIPWDIPEDRKHFKELTMGHVLVMGRHTYEEIGHPLPGRVNIVVSKTLAAERGGAHALNADNALQTKPLSEAGARALKAENVLLSETLSKADARVLQADNALSADATHALKEDDGLLYTASLDDALRLAGEVAPGKTVFIAGGGMLYKAALPLSDVLYLTEIDAEVAGDTYFPAAAFEGRSELLQPLFVESEVTGSGVSASGLMYRYVTYRRLPWSAV